MHILFFLFLLLGTCLVPSSNTGEIRPTCIKFYIDNKSPAQTWLSSDKNGFLHNYLKFQRTKKIKEGTWLKARAKQTQFKVYRFHHKTLQILEGKVSKQTLWGIFLRVKFQFLIYSTGFHFVADQYLYPHTEIHTRLWAQTRNTTIKGHHNPTIYTLEYTDPNI